MNMLASWLKSAALGMLIAFLPLASASAGDSVPKPLIQKGQGEQCVEDTDFMRRNHMKVLDHHRDKTMREGIRTKQHSLKNCIDCHATPDASGQRTVLGKDHFCQSCHTYAAVQVDCFQCHSSKPAGNAAMHPIVPAQSGAGARTAAEMRHQTRSKLPSHGTTLSVKELSGVVK
jgi:hypothetical protein